jgi:DNA-binding NarL/FixJ family response regulator
VDDAPGLHVVATVTDPDGAMTALRTLHPDIVLIDIRLPNQMAWFLTRATRRESPSTRVVVLSNEVDEALVEHAADAGAAAVIVERIGAEDLGAVLRTVGGESIDLLGYVVRKAG